MIARLRFWIASLLLLSAVFAGCAGTPETRARKVITGWDLLNSAAPRLARPAIKDCGDRAVATAKTGSVADARANLASCYTARSLVSRSLHASLDATDAAAIGVDVAEAAKAKDYNGILQTAFPAVRDLWDALNQIGVKNLPPLVGVP